MESKVDTGRIISVKSFPISTTDTVATLTSKTYDIQLFQFLEQASTDSLVTRDYDDSYNDLKVKVSFGQGVLSRVPWVSFLKEPNTTSKGIYPVYLLYKNNDKLVLAYGISETNTPNQSWDLTNPQSISEYFTNEN